jgi:hypothetical protein
MAYSTHTPLWNQVEPFSHQFAQAPGLPFGDVLHPSYVQTAFAAEGAEGVNCVYNPLTTVFQLVPFWLKP